jgi:ethanolaminephosphotransferase
MFIANTQKWSRNAQDIMSSTASNYDMYKLTAGEVIASLAAVLALGAAIPTLARSFVSAIPFLTITIAYGIMMFASSYVEEEQHFWYWATSGWLALLSFKGYGVITRTSTLLTADRISRYARSSALLNLGALGILGALRIVRRWNQTGQKFAGEADIARTFLSTHTELLWGLIAATYIWNAQTLGKVGFPSLPRPIAAALAVTLMIFAVNFKLAFTNEDAPELISGRAMTILRLSAGWDLITRARMVFLSIAVCLVFTIGREFFYVIKHVPWFRGSMISGLSSENVANSCIRHNTDDSRFTRPLPHDSIKSHKHPLTFKLSSSALSARKTEPQSD